MYRLCTRAGSCHVLMDPSDFAEALAASYEERANWLAHPREVHELPQPVACQGYGYRFAFDVDGEVGVSREEVEVSLAQLGEAAARAVAAVLQDCCNLREADETEGPSHEKLMRLTESLVITRDWEATKDPASLKFSAHVVVSPPCVTDQLGMNLAAAVLLRAELETVGFPGTVDLGIYGGSKCAQLRAAGVGPVCAESQKPAMVPWGRWRHGPGWTRLHEVRPFWPCGGASRCVLFDTGRRPGRTEELHVDRARGGLPRREDCERECGNRARQGTRAPRPSRTDAAGVRHDSRAREGHLAPLVPVDRGPGYHRGCGEGTESRRGRDSLGCRPGGQVGVVRFCAEVPETRFCIADELPCASGRRLRLLRRERGPAQERGGDRQGFLCSRDARRAAPEPREAPVQTLGM